MTRSAQSFTTIVRRERGVGPALWLVMWLALAGIFASPVIATAHMLEMAGAIDDSAICHAPGTDHPAAPDHGKMVMCDLCVSCAPVAALDANPPELAQPRLILLTKVLLPVQPQAPPSASFAAAYPRGPPASI